MGDEATSEGPGREGRQRWEDELAAARNALEEARRQAARSAPRVRRADRGLRPSPRRLRDGACRAPQHYRTAPPRRVAARDLTIGYQQARIDELEAEVGRLRTALQVLTGLGLPETKPTDQPKAGEQ